MSWISIGLFFTFWPLCECHASRNHYHRQSVGLSWEAFSWSMCGSGMITTVINIVKDIIFSSQQPSKTPHIELPLKSRLEVDVSLANSCFCYMNCSTNNTKDCIRPLSLQMYANNFVFFYHHKQSDKTCNLQRCSHQRSLPLIGFEVNKVN